MLLQVTFIVVHRCSNFINSPFAVSLVIVMAFTSRA
jgi:preprotein translocase subunit SecF